MRDRDGDSGDNDDDGVDDVGIGKVETGRHELGAQRLEGKWSSKQREGRLQVSLPTLSGSEVEPRSGPSSFAAHPSLCSAAISGSGPQRSALLPPRATLR